jgi:hypothetical protein
MHAPHSPERYIELMRAVFRKKRVARLGKVYGGMIGGLYPIDRRDHSVGVEGEIYRFLKLDPNEPWFNTATKEAASEEEVQQINIPEHLLPHLQRVPFVFHAKSHRLHFVSKDRSDVLGPSVAKRLLDQLFQPVISNGLFPAVEVTVMPDKETLERIFAMPTISTLRIDLVRPNADDGEDEEQRWLRRLADQESRRMRVELSAERGGTVTPDQDTISMAKVAAKNGAVLAEGRDAAGTRARESTTDRPLVEAVEVDSEYETAIDVLRRTARALDAQ